MWALWAVFFANHWGARWVLVSCIKCSSVSGQQRQKGPVQCQLPEKEKKFKYIKKNLIRLFQVYMICYEVVQWSLLCETTSWPAERPAYCKWPPFSCKKQSRSCNRPWKYETTPPKETTSGWQKRPTCNAESTVRFARKIWLLSCWGGGVFQILPMRFTVNGCD